MNSLGLSNYVCPRTLLPLKGDGADLASDDGLVRYPVRCGVPNFLRFESAEDETTQALLVELNRLALSDGWRAALEMVYGRGSGMLRYVTDESRAAFVDLLPIEVSSHVLEIGPGLGQFTSALALRADSVFALEVVPGQAEFARERCRQSGQANVQFAVGGDDCRLPYSDRSFDLVVLNLVFEWCASRCNDETHLAAQTRLLEQIARVLRPGGTLYLSTKNRFSLHYLLGKRDEHYFDVRFGSALPRWLAPFVLKLRGHGRTPGMLYSHDTLDQMLRDAGFCCRQSFWAAPEVRFPTRMVPTDPGSIRQARRDRGLVQGAFRSTQMLMPLVPAPLVKHCAQGLVFLATKSK